MRSRLCALTVVPLALAVAARPSDESTLEADAKSVAAEMGVKVQPDPAPLRNYFTRGQPGSKEVQIGQDWMAARYHARGDNANQPIDMASAAKFNELTERLLLRVANESKRPAWEKGSFFKRFAK